MLKLSPDVLVRYTEKLKVNQRKSKLSSILDQFPPIDELDITMYLTNSRRPYFDDEVKAYKSLESYKYYESKYISV
jgi:hypothetical protein